MQAANTASSDSTARAAAQNEITQLRDEIDRIGQTTAFGNQKLLDGTFGAQAATLHTTFAGQRRRRVDDDEHGSFVAACSTAAAASRSGSFRHVS